MSSMNTRTSHEQQLHPGQPLASGPEPPLAAHLVTPRRGYLHHGLYLGGGRVIHYAGLAGGRQRRTVEEVSLEQFARGRSVYVRAATANFTADEVIRRARSRRGENRYRILSNNCEHFCEWCLRGASRSAQVEELRTRRFVRWVARLIDARFALAEAVQRLVSASAARPASQSFDPAFESICE